MWYLFVSFYSIINKFCYTNEQFIILFLCVYYATIIALDQTHTCQVIIIALHQTLACTCQVIKNLIVAWWYHRSGSTLAQVMAWCRAITWTNVYLSVRYNGKHLMAISQEVTQPSIAKLSLKSHIWNFIQISQGLISYKLTHYIPRVMHSVISFFVLLGSGRIYPCPSVLLQSNHMTTLEPMKHPCRISVKKL